MNSGKSGCASSTTSRRWSMALTLALTLVLSVLLNGCYGSISRPVQVNPDSNKHRVVDHAITFAFQQSFANNGPCSSTVTTSCISGFNEGYLSGTTHVQLHNDSASVCSGTTQPESCSSSFNGLLPIGSIVFYVDTTFVDQNGAAGVTADALSSPVQVGADSVQSVVVTVK